MVLFKIHELIVHLNSNYRYNTEQEIVHKRLKTLALPTLNKTLIKKLRVILMQNIFQALKNNLNKWAEEFKHHKQKVLKDNKVIKIAWIKITYILFNKQPAEVIIA